MNNREPSVVLFDGVCNFCSASVGFIIRRDSRGAFRFASLQSRTGQAFLAQFPALRGVDSVILIANGVPYTESSAALRIAACLRGPWMLAAVLLAVPRPIRDGCYRFIAKRRYRWFGRKDACMIPTKEMKARFLLDEE